MFAFGIGSVTHAVSEHRWLVGVTPTVSFHIKIKMKLVVSQPLKACKSSNMVFSFCESTFSTSSIGMKKTWLCMNNSSSPSMAKCSKRYSEITTMSVSEALIIILLQPFLIAERACKIPSYLLPHECWKEDILLSKHASENALSMIIFSEAMKNIFLSILSIGFVVIYAVKTLEIG